MSETSKMKSWEDLNKEFLISALDSLYIRLENIYSEKIKADKKEFTDIDLLNSDSAFSIICRTFNLSIFESEILLLCAGYELDNRFPVLMFKTSK